MPTTIDRYQDTVLVGLVLASALLVWRPLVDPFMLVKLTAVLVLVIALVSLEAVRAALLRRIELPAGRWAVVLGALVVALLVATVVSSTTGLAVVGRYTRFTGLLPYLAYLLVMLIVIRRGWTSMGPLLRRSLVVSMTVVAAYTLLQVVGADPVDWGPTPLGARFATMANPNFSSAYLGVCVPLALSLALSSREPRAWRIFAAAGVPLGFLAAVLSQSIQGPVVAVVGLAVVLVVALSTGARRVLAGASTARRAGLAAGAAAVVAAVSTVGYLLATDLLQSLSQRRYFWAAALDMFRDSPLVGQGLEGFANEFLRFRSAEGAVLYGVESADAAHSVPLGMLANGGLLLGLSYAAFVGVTGYAAVRALRRTAGDERMLVAGFAGAWVAYQVQSLVSFDVPPLALLHYLTAGVLLSAGGVVTIRSWPAQRPAEAPRRRQPVRRPQLTTAGKSAIAAVVVLALVSLVLATRPLRADLNAVQAAQDLGNRDVPAAIASFDRAIALAPWEPSYRSLRASVLSQVGEPARGFAGQAEAARRDPGSSLYALLAARDAVAAGLPREAAQWYNEGVDRDPVRPDVLLEAGRHFLGAQDAARAIALFAAAADIQEDAQTLVLLAQARAAEGDRDGAIRSLERALALEPDFQPALDALAALQQSPGS